MFIYLHYTKLVRLVVTYFVVHIYDLKKKAQAEDSQARSLEFYRSQDNDEIIFFEDI